LYLRSLEFLAKSTVQLSINIIYEKNGKSSSLYSRNTHLAQSQRSRSGEEMNVEILMLNLKGLSPLTSCVCAHFPALPPFRLANRPIMQHSNGTTRNLSLRRTDSRLTKCLGLRLSPRCDIVHRYRDPSCLVTPQNISTWVQKSTVNRLTCTVRRPLRPVQLNIGGA
jgi:hypothetical protein